MQHFRSGSSNSEFQPRRSGSKEEWGKELRGQVEAIKRRYRKDWIVLANKLRS